MAPGHAAEASRVAGASLADEHVAAVMRRHEDAVVVVQSARGLLQLARTERRSMTGRWNTMACRRRPAMAPAANAQCTAPWLGTINPWQSLSSNDFPAPFGPITSVMPPLARVKLT